MKFISLKNWLFEKKQSKKVEYGCVMLYATVPNWKDHISIIDKDDIYDDEIKDFGLEKTPHCTVLWGIHLDETEPENVKKFISTFSSIEVTINNISIFPGGDYDVVKYDVPVTPELLKYRDALIANFPNTQTFPDYHPHMTIAYVLHGSGKKYVKKIKPFKVKFDTIVYSFKGGNKEGKNNIKIKLS